MGTTSLCKSYFKWMLYNSEICVLFWKAWHHCARDVFAVYIVSHQIRCVRKFWKYSILEFYQSQNPVLQYNIWIQKRGFERVIEECEFRQDNENFELGEFGDLFGKVELENAFWRSETLICKISLFGMLLNTLISHFLLFMTHSMIYEAITTV